MIKQAVKSALARAYSDGEEPAYISVAPNGRDEMWGIGDIAFVVPVVPNDAPPELEFALRVRRNALLTGRCDECDAIVGTYYEFRIAEMNVAGTLIPHRRNCPAADDVVFPQLQSYYKSRNEKTLADALTLASKKTKRELDEQIKSRVELPNEKYEAWVQELLDRKSIGTLVELCGHLRTSPAQTRSMLLGLDKWHCDECWTYLQYEITNGRFRLPLVDDRSCDHCGRFVSDLQFLVIRVNNFVLRGGMCKRCANASGQIKCNDTKRRRLRYVQHR